MPLIAFTALLQGLILFYDLLEQNQPPSCVFGSPNYIVLLFPKPDCYQNGIGSSLTGISFGRLITDQNVRKSCLQV